MTQAGETPQIHSNASDAGDGRLSAPSALRNVGPISRALAQIAPQAGVALEIASGTGQHVVAYARAFPNVTWQPTDIAPERLASIDAWVAAEGLGNIRPARGLDASTPDWDAGRYDLVLMSNLFHLISAQAAGNVIAGAARALNPGGRLFIYGPFREAGAFRSQGDADFHANIIAAQPDCGYKSVEWMQETALARGLNATGRIEMPANNVALHWQKKRKDAND
ncbi:MAG TPA: DUF938 domain-containing protein [Aliiroseovarius sp.]|nr:DUF938 domain-containing protein [Aliiroseovarius sp.]